MNELIPASEGPGGELAADGHGIQVPKIVAAVGDEASYHFLNFFISNIRNPNTRRAYARHVRDFCSWCEKRGIDDVRKIKPPHVAAYIEVRSKEAGERVSGVKQALSAIRMLSDWLVVHHVLAINPAASVRGPKLVVTEGVTPVLDSNDVVSILESIRTDSLIGLRDRALVAFMVFTFARISAATTMRVGHYYTHGKRKMVRLHEKGGKRKVIAVHHRLEEYLDAYIEAAGIAEEKKSPLFRTAYRKTGRLTENAMIQSDAWRVMQRRARQAGVTSPICNHSWRGTGITNYLEHGGALETAQWMAGHADARTTKLYDRRRQKATLDEVERIRFDRRA